MFSKMINLPVIKTCGFYYMTLTHFNLKKKSYEIFMEKKLYLLRQYNSSGLKLVKDFCIIR